MTFATIFTTSIFLIVMLLLHKLLNSRVSKSFFLIVWGLVFLKLIIPYNVSSPLSIYNLVASNNIPEQIWQSEQILIPPVNVNGNGEFVQQGNQEMTVAQADADMDYDIQMQQQSLLQYMKAFAYHNLILLLWIGGALSAMIFFNTMYQKEVRKIKKTIKPLRNRNIRKLINSFHLKRRPRAYTSENVTTPLTYGILRPKIVLPADMDFENAELINHVVIHELVHIKRFDIILKYLGLAGLCLHWFNPLVWMSYRSLCIDIEISCDEKVLETLGANNKSNYAMSLITMAEYKRSLNLNLISAFGEQPIKERVLNIMNYKKTKFVTTFLCAALTVGSVSVFATAATPENFTKEPKVYTAENAHEQPLRVYPMTNLQINNGMAKEAPMAQAEGNNQPINVQVDVLPAKTYRHIGTFSLTEGDMITTSNFSVPKDDSRIVLAINDERFAANNGLYDVAASIYGQLNDKFVAEEDGIYEIWVGNAANQDYTNLTGLIQAEQNDYTINDYLDYERPALPEYLSEEELEPYRQQLLALEEKKDTMSENEYNGEKSYLNSILNPNRDVGIARLSVYSEAYVNSIGVTHPATLISTLIHERPLEYMLSVDEYQDFLNDGEYSNMTRYFIYTVKASAPEKNILPTDKVTMDEINNRWSIIDTRLGNCYHFMDESFMAITEEHKEEAEAMLIKLVKEEFGIENMDGIEISLDVDRPNVVDLTNIPYDELPIVNGVLDMTGYDEATGTFGPSSFAE